MDLGNGVTLEAADLRVRPSGVAGRRMRGGDIATGTDAQIDVGLDEAGFEIPADVILEPSGGLRRGGGAQQAELRVQVTEGQNAVLLLESAGGVFTWAYADDAAVKPGSVRRTGGQGPVELVFTLSPSPIGRDAAPERRQRGWLADRLIEPIRIRVLRFIAAKGIDSALKHLEGDFKPGLVVLGADPAAWTPGAVLPAFAADRAPRILLMVHGTFSTTLGSFQALTATPEGQGFLATAADKYDAILGYDHRTLTEDPDRNALDILKAIEGLPPGAEIDAVAYSRGGLVYRALAERVATARPELVFRDAAFVGCTNGGTNLAEPANWKHFADFYTNIAVAGANTIALLGGGAASAALTFVIKTIGRFVQVIPEVAISDGKVPGLAAMEPDGAYVIGLNEATGALSAGRRYGVIASDFEPRIEPSKGLTGELVEYLVDGVMDRLLGAQNDLVVHTSSMSQFGARQYLLDASRMQVIDPREVVYHTIYFASPHVAGLLRAWLVSERPGALSTPQGPAAPPSAFATPPAPASPTILPGWLRDIGTRRQRNVGVPAASPEWQDDLAPDDLATGGAPEADDLAGGSEDVGGDGGQSYGAGGDLTGGGASYAPARRTRGGAAALDGATAPAPLAGQVEYNFAASINPVLSLDQPAWLWVTVSPDGVSLDPGDLARAGTASVDLGQKIHLDVVGLLNCRVAEDTPSGCEMDPPLGSTATRFLIEGFQPGRALIQIEARQAGRSLAAFVLEPVFVAEGAAQLTASQTAVAGLPAGDPAVMRIYEIVGANGQVTLRFDLSKVDPSIAAVNEMSLPHGFNMDAFVGDFLARLESAYGKETRTYEGFLSSIRDFSIVQTNGLIPREIREELWKHRDKIDAIQVISDSPQIPWELLCVVDPAGGAAKKARFLCEWGLVRWLYNARWPRLTLKLRSDHVRYVIPDYLNKADQLEGAHAERKMLQKRFPKASEVAATSVAVRSFLSDDAGDCDVLHFACHGQASQAAVLNSSLLMQGIPTKTGVEDDYVEYTTVETNAAFAGDGESGLVFINACQTGREGRGIAGVAGFAKAFIKPMSGKGASAFVGALWSVDDALALNFSDAFYEALQQGKTLAGAASAGRAACQSKQDFTWLAYTVYGAPNARQPNL